MGKQSNREKCPGPYKGWSKWETAMVPDKKTVLTPCTKRRNNPGYYCKDIKTAFIKDDKNVSYDSGIYEWKAVKPNGREYVVYIGSTHRQTRKDLERRIMEYCRNGSHKAKAIDEVLRDGYEMHVRVKPIAGNRKKSENAENKLLKKYNYAWNKRLNAPKRESKVPPRKRARR